LFGGADGACRNRHKPSPLAGGATPHGLGSRQGKFPNAIRKPTAFWYNLLHQFDIGCTVGHNWHGGDTEMANVQKYNRGQIGGLTRHYERGQREDGTYYAFGNQEIDTSLSHLNYNLAPERDGGQLSFIGKRTSEVKYHNRTDVNVMCSWVITAPKLLAESEHKLFFQEAYSFLNQRYANGSDRNVISAYVHMDESTPHLHYAFVPVVHDKKKGIDKVSAKIAIDRVDLQKFHQDLERHMAGVFGREIGILNEATRDGNKSIDELKRETAQAEIDTLNKNIIDSRNILADVLFDTSVAEIERKEHEKLSAEIKNLRNEKAQLDKELSDNHATVKKLKKHIKELNPHVDRRSYGAIRDFEETVRDEVKGRLVGTGKTITEKGWNSLHHWARVGLSNASTAEAYETKAKVLDEENKNLSRRVQILQSYYDKLAPVLNSPYKPEFEALERKTRNWSQEQQNERREATAREKQVQKEQASTMPTMKRPKSRENDR